MKTYLSWRLPRRRRRSYNDWWSVRQRNQGWNRSCSGCCDIFACKSLHQVFSDNLLTPIRLSWDDLAGCRSSWSSLSRNYIMKFVPTFLLCHPPVPYFRTTLSGCQLVDCFDLSSTLPLKPRFSFLLQVCLSSVYVTVSVEALVLSWRHAPSHDKISCLYALLCIYAWIFMRQRMRSR